MGHRERGWLYAALVAGAISAMAFSTMRADIVGLFHDDGIYVVTARSLAAGTGYRISSLPGSPAQTKYPILYPYLLSWIWKASPAFPANILLLKSFNALIAFAVMLLGYSLFCRYIGRFGISALAYVFLVGTNMLLVSTADFTLSDNLFQVFVIACLLLHDQGPGSRPTWRIWFGAVMASLGFLTRVSGRVVDRCRAGVDFDREESSRRDRLRGDRGGADHPLVRLACRNRRRDESAAALLHRIRNIGACPGPVSSPAGLADRFRKRSLPLAVL